jgi:diacylglycerol kinase (ATP)
MHTQRHTGLKRIVAAFGNSVAGLRFALKRDTAVRQEFVLVALLVPVALFSGKAAIEILLLVSGLFAVVITELLNTAIECAIDRISTDYHDLSKASKDIASAAVLLSLLYCGLVWGVIFLG